jgi:NAD(P)-dependent dehydrogenase (short-subunit alcohol dehydrogenase family)
VADPSPLLLLVGIGPGLGLSLARRWAREGYRLALVGEDDAFLDRTVAALEGEGVSARAFAAHTGNPEVFREALADVKGLLGHPETLIFNASVSHEAPVSRLLPAAFEADLRANAEGFLLAIQAVLPAMRVAGHGSILLTGGGSALNPTATGASLGVGKAAQRSLLLSLAKELEGSGIRAATLTIRGFIQRGTDFDPDLLADHMWALHTQYLAKSEIERIVG